MGSLRLQHDLVSKPLSLCVKSGGFFVSLDVSYTRVHLHTCWCLDEAFASPVKLNGVFPSRVPQVLSPKVTSDLWVTEMDDYG